MCVHCFYFAGRCWQREGEMTSCSALTEFGCTRRFWYYLHCRNILLDIILLWLLVSMWACGSFGDNSGRCLQQNTTSANDSWYKRWQRQMFKNSQSSIWWCAGVACELGVPERAIRGYICTLQYFCRRFKSRSKWFLSKASLFSIPWVLRCSSIVGSRHWPFQVLWLCLIQVRLILALHSLLQPSCGRTSPHCRHTK